LCVTQRSPDEHVQWLQLPLAHWELAGVPQMQTGLISCSPKEPLLLRRSPLNEQGLPCLAVPKLSPHSLESSQQGVRWGETLPPLQSWDTDSVLSSPEEVTSSGGPGSGGLTGWDHSSGQIQTTLFSQAFDVCIFSRQHRPRICFGCSWSISW